MRAGTPCPTYAAQQPQPNERTKRVTDDGVGPVRVVMGAEAAADLAHRAGLGIGDTAFAVAVGGANPGNGVGSDDDDPPPPLLGSVSEARPRGRSATEGSRGDDETAGRGVRSQRHNKLYEADCNGATIEVGLGFEYEVGYNDKEPRQGDAVADAAPAYDPGRSTRRTTTTLASMMIATATASSSRMEATTTEASTTIKAAAPPRGTRTWRSGRVRRQRPVRRLQRQGGWTRLLDPMSTAKVPTVTPPSPTTASPQPLPAEDSRERLMEQPT